LGQFEGALTSFDTSIGLSADHAEAYASRGLALHGLKRYAQALASYDKAIGLQPGFALAYNNRGLTHQALRDFSSAVHDYQAAIAHEPSLSQAYSNLGTVFKAMHRFDDALLAYDQSLALRPAVAQVLCNRGAVLQALQRADEAKACFDQAIALDADLVEAHCHRAYVSLLLGDWMAGWLDGGPTSGGPSTPSRALRAATFPRHVGPGTIPCRGKPSWCTPNKAWAIPCSFAGLSAAWRIAVPMWFLKSSAPCLHCCKPCQAWARWLRQGMVCQTSISIAP
jgi:tetratricopeptide (TPR) repeat protein